MRKKFTILVSIFFFAFMLNISAISFQQRYDRREEDQESDPFVIEMTDLNIFKFLKNTYYFDLPDNILFTESKVYFINDELGFGNQYEIKAKYFKTCQLKFVLINYIGFYNERSIKRTYYMNC